MDKLPGQYARCKRTLGGYDGGGQWRVDRESLDVIPEDAYPVMPKQRSRSILSTPLLLVVTLRVKPPAIQ